MPIKTIHDMQKINNDFFANNSIIHDLPIVKSLLYSVMDRNLVHRDNGEPYSDSNMLLANYPGYFSISNLEYIARCAFYVFLKGKKTHQVEKGEQTILFSPYMCSRFPGIVQRIASWKKIKFFVTAVNWRFSRNQNAFNILKSHHLFYCSKQNQLLGDILKQIKICFLKGLPLGDESKQLLVLEELLKEKVKKIAEVMKDNNIEQFITSYNNRFDDILICHACKLLDIPSKEISHGISTIGLSNGQTIVPKITDFLLVWSDFAKEQIAEYGGDVGRIQVIGYPKYTQENADELQSRYPQKKQVIFFSQATRHIFSTPNVEISEDIVEVESEFRKKLLGALRKVAKAKGFGLKVRYHNGELAGTDCDRAKEREWLESQDDIVVSSASFVEDMFESELCVGVNTSCLYEASVLSKKVLQIKWPLNKDSYFKDIESCSVGEVEYKLTKLLSEHNEKMPTNGFIEDLKLINIGLFK